MSFRIGAWAIAAVLAAACSVDRTGRGSVRDADGGMLPGIDGGGPTTMDARIEPDAPPAPVDAPPDRGVDAWRPRPCVPECTRGGEACVDGVCVCAGDSFCCSDCPRPGFVCDEGTGACECMGHCACAGCPADHSCLPDGSCMELPAPACGAPGEACCAGRTCDGTNVCDETSPFSGSYQCYRCGEAYRQCCPGRMCEGGRTCGMITGRCI